LGIPPDSTNREKFEKKMAEQKYRLVLSGDVVVGFTRSEVSSALARLLKMSDEQATELLQGKRSRIRQHLEFDRAERLCSKVLARGAGCSIEPVSSAEDESDILDMINGQTEDVLGLGLDIDDLEKSLGLDEDSAPIQQEPLGSLGLELEESRVEEPDEANLPSKSVENDIPEPDDDATIILESPPLIETRAKPAEDVDQSEPDSGTEQFFEQPHVVKVDSSGTKGQSGGGRTRILLMLVLLVAATVAGLQVTGMFDFSEPTEKPQAIHAKPAPPKNPKLALTEKRLGALMRSVKVWMIQFGSGFNPAQVTLDRLGADLGIESEELVDGWGAAIRYEPLEESYIVRSAGPDGQFDSQDDLTREGKL
jgi:hypothetical protein